MARREINWFSGDFSGFYRATTIAVNSLLQLRRLQNLWGVEAHGSPPIYVTSIGGLGLSTQSNMPASSSAFPSTFASAAN